MKKIIINDSNLEDKDIDYSVIRVKALVVNEEGKLILAHNNGTFQFPGGHLEEDENLKDALIREVKEETGINNMGVRDCFLEIVTYDDNYFDSGKHVINKIYYYKIETKDKPDLNNTSYDEIESSTPFNLYYLDDYKLIDFINKKLETKEIDEKIAREMLLVAEAYNYIYKEEDVI
ncbi:MAG: NUDIX hydrolase [Bacilli bacterium]|nr:NUDIX hydrolase [Bacilli bacterium]